MNNASQIQLYKRRSFLAPSGFLQLGNLNLKQIGLLGLLLFSTPLLAQRTAKKTAESSQEYTINTAYGVNTNTNSGLLGGFAFKREKLLDTKGKNQWQLLSLELINVRSLKERASTTSTGSRFVFGKQNYLFSLRPQYGREFTLFKKTNTDGLQINGILAGGPSIGLVKPYYIQYNFGRSNIRTEAYNPLVHNNENAIVASGSLFDGIGEITPKIGANAKVALNVELSSFQRSNIGLEIGFLVEAYSEEIKIMALAPNRSNFTSGYITLYFGNRR